MLTRELSSIEELAQWSRTADSAFPAYPRPEKGAKTHARLVQIFLGLPKNLLDELKERAEEALEEGAINGIFDLLNEILRGVPEGRNDRDFKDC